TPIFARFSTVQGGSSSADTVRDVRGFSLKFYTEEGNYDFVGNNFPVFIIQDAMKFPDVIHALKPEPHHHMPQGASAHDNFWDFVSLSPETTHMVMWAMSDRGIPRSYRMIPGFGIHTFRFINKNDESTFMKFHIKPKLGIHTLVWDEAQKINGKDPDFHRRDLWESIDAGMFPEWEVFAQFLGQEDVFEGIDLLDPTKMIPEELAPLTLLGKIVLNRNPDNFFAETEQVAFHPGHLVPGIDFSDDPLLQGRLFSYTDTQLSRLGGPNFHEIPINRPHVEINNNQRDAIKRMDNPKGRVNYEPNSFAGGSPKETPQGFVSFAEKMKGLKVRGKDDSFRDHFSQATMFWSSQTPIEQKHIVDAFSFELSKVEAVHVRKQVVSNLQFVNKELASKVAANLGLDFSEVIKLGLAESTASGTKLNVKSPTKNAGSLSVLKTFKKAMPEGRKVGILVMDDAKKAEVISTKKALLDQKIFVKLVTFSPEKRKEIEADYLINMATSVEFDGLIIMGTEIPKDRTFLQMGQELATETFKHFKTISVENVSVAQKLIPILQKDDPGVSFKSKMWTNDFLKDLGQHKHWERFNT
nr:catalase [Bdellovibrionales bacterium]